jgi:hypothetical protein
MPASMGARARKGTTQCPGRRSTDGEGLRHSEEHQRQTLIRRLTVHKPVAFPLIVREAE